MRDILYTTAISFCLAAALGLALLVLSIAGCHASWADNRHKFGLMSGCMVEVDGKWVPTRNVRVIK